MLLAEGEDLYAMLQRNVPTIYRPLGTGKKVPSGHTVGCLLCL
jgi:hypothetical protein